MDEFEKAELENLIFTFTEELSSQFSVKVLVIALGDNMNSLITFKGDVKKDIDLFLQILQAFKKGLVSDNLKERGMLN